MEKKIHLKFYPNPTRTNGKGEMPVYLRITVDRKKAEISTGVSCLENLWNLSEFIHINSDFDLFEFNPIDSTNTRLSVDQLFYKLIYYFLK
jgi:hypothetical protein